MRDTYNVILKKLCIQKLSLPAYKKKSFLLNKLFNCYDKTFSTMKIIFRVKTD